MRKLVMLLLGVLLLCGQLLAQTRVITGKVLDSKGNPVPNATILIKGSQTGTSSGQDGSYSLTVPSNARTLVVSSVGYNPMDVSISGATVNVVLSDVASQIDEVVITGYTRVQKTKFAGAATVLSGKAVETVPVGSFDQALQGRVPGMLVNSGSGQPGAAASVTIRGVQTIGGATNQPLYILDGIPLPTGVFETLNPNDFESLTVLKDANAAAMYGSRAGNGVIVITSKKGKGGETRFQYRSQYGITQRTPWNNFDMMTTAEILQYEEREKIAGTPGWNYSKLNPAYASLTPTQQARYDFLRDSLSKIETDVNGLFFRQGFSQQQELNMTGGSEKTRFYISGSMFDQKGTEIRSRLKRYTTRFNIDHTSNKVSVQFNNTVGYSKMDLTEGEWYGNSTRNLFQMSWRSKPYENPYRPDGSLIYGASTALVPKVIGNALEGVQNSIWTQKQLKANSGLTVAYKLLPNLLLKNTLGVDLTSDVYQRWINPDSYIGSLQTYQKGLDAESYRISSQIINTSSAVYNKRFGKHDIEIGAYFEALRAYQKALGFTVYYLDGRLPETGQGAGASSAGYYQTATSAKSGYGIRSYFGMATYTFDDRVTVNGSLRRDGTSRIVNDANKEVTTWSVGAIWNMMRENFMSTQNILTDLRLRASYGSVPNINSIPLGSYGIASLASVTNYQSPQVPAFGSTTYAGTSIVGLSPTTIGNPTLRMETIQKYNAGLDFAVWQDRARFTVDVYKNRTVDLFVRQNLSALAGVSTTPQQDINAGIMSNKGLEFTASVDVVKTPDLLLTVGLNHSINKNTIESLGGASEYVLGTYLIKEGLPFGSHYTTHYLGADPATGQPTYEDANGNTIIGTAGAQSFAKFGTYLPKHVGGFTADFKFKNFTVGALFSYQFDVVRSNNIENWVTRGTPGYHGAVNASRRLLTQQWQKAGDIAWYQASGYDRGFTSSDLMDAKFLRFRNLNVAYQIPGITVGSTKVFNSARVYVQMQNIAIWSPWRGPDPEDNNNISLNEFPNPRAIVAGLDINF